MEPLAKLFGSPARLKTLRLFFFNKDTVFTATDIAQRTKLSKQVVRKALSDLLSAGLVRKKGAQTPARYQVNGNFEHFSALELFIRDTTSVRPQDIIATLRRAGSLRLVALSGLFTGIHEPKVDLLVVGDALDERALTNAVHAL